jgi:hypothetical protein
MVGGDPEDLANVSVIIPVRDDPRLLNCVASVLSRCDEVGRMEVMVVDHLCSVAFRADVLAHLPPSVKVLEFAGETVYGARQAGVAQATGQVLFFTDADCIVRPGWIAEAIRTLEAGGDLAQGFSGSLGRSRADTLMQRRYEAHFRRVRPGDGTECDTRNLAVRRSVFEAVEFPEGWRRTGDTYLGLLSEARGFRVAYSPAMRVDHAHDTDLSTFIAKQICHGWGAQRLMQEHPEVQWHGGHLRLVARLARSSSRFPGQRGVARLLGRLMIWSAGMTGRLLPVLPLGVAGIALLATDKGGALAGHLLYEAGTDEPRLSDLVGRSGVVG